MNPAIEYVSSAVVAKNRESEKEHPEKFHRKSQEKISINIESFGGKGDGITDNGPAFTKALAALPNGGIINFGKGVFTNHTRWLIKQSNITIKGQGPGNTVLTADSSVARTFDIGLERGHENIFQEGAKGDSSVIFPFVNKTKKGDDYIELKNKTWIENFPVGQKIFIRGGASYYDQDFGEINVVVKKYGNKLYLKYPLSRNYDYEGENWFGALLKDFKPPKVGGIAMAIIQHAPQKKGMPISIGNEIYSVVSEKGDTVFLLNPGRANSTNVIPAGTHVTKGRQVIIDRGPSNDTIDGLTIQGKQTRVFSADNTFNTLIVNCVITRDPIIRVPGPFIFTVDRARNVRFKNVVFQAPDVLPSTGQISRSSGDISFSECVFKNVSTDFSEFCFNSLVDSCTYDIINQKFATRMGKTASNCIATNTKFKIKGGSEAISMDDIQGFKNSQRKGCIVNSCYFEFDGTNTVIQNMGEGTNAFTNNVITGNFNAICLTLRIEHPDIDENKQTILLFKKNTIRATINRPLFNEGNADIEDNNFTLSGNPAHADAGIIVANSVKDTSLVFHLKLKNNNFNNWLKKENKISNYDDKANGSKMLEISNNVFNYK
ncbi:glycosyl hydrolase family 28-related protein [Mucilaginibacter gotjawali]|nr:glycosyl hydrolase family 28-related protein [Mucilaginibacter gotjawali]MBB3057510.1 hypothetical protein [Mucilaginibacter gotjawali]